MYFTDRIRSSNRSRQVQSVKGVITGGLRQKSDSRSAAIPLFLRISEMKGSNFFACVQDLFDEALSPQYETSLLGSYKLKGNVLRGG
jgi:hypothetical protein